jgi:hypothetical protein
MPALYSYLKPDEIAFRTLIFGPYGSSKTTIATSAHLSEKLGPVLVIDIDGGLSSVTHHEDLIQVPVHTPAELDQVINDLQLPNEKRPEILRGVRTVVFDSVSAFRDETLVNVTAGQVAKNKRDDQYSPEWKDYGKTTGLILNKFDAIRRMKMNLIITAGSTDVMDGDRILSTRPNLNKALLDGLNYRMSNIWYVERSKQEARYRMLIVPPKQSQRFDIKTRNAAFAKALSTLTRTEAQARGEKEVDKWDGWYLIPENTHPTIPILYDVFLEATKKDFTGGGLSQTA